jgi:RNA polymerase sigma-70 factor (ECF subfamily)
MDDTDPVTDLLRRLRAEEPQAAQKVFARYSERLLPLARQHLGRKLAGRADAEDVVQSAFRTFFRRISRGEFHIDGSARLWRLLVRITLMKARATARRHTAAVRDVGREEPGGDAWFHETIALDPRPEDAAAVADQIEQLLTGLPPLFGEVLERLLAGESKSDVARAVGLSRPTVYECVRVLQRRLRDGLRDADL